MAEVGVVLPVESVWLNDIDGGLVVICGAKTGSLSDASGTEGLKGAGEANIGGEKEDEDDDEATIGFGVVTGQEHCHVSPVGNQLPLSGTLHCDHDGSLHIHLAPSVQTSPGASPHSPQSGISASVDGGDDAETVMTGICRRITIASAHSMH